MDNQAQAVLDEIDKRINKGIPIQADKRFSATIVSTYKGVATVHLANDPIGTNIVVQNSRELLLNPGDQVYVNAINGNLTNAFVDLKKGYNDKYPIQADKRFDATVNALSTNNTVQVQLDIDPVGTYLTIPNLRELPTVVGDRVSVVAINGDQTNAYVDFRRSILIDTIYVNWATGSDLTGDGTSIKPFKSLQKAVNSLAKNLNSRRITIYYSGSGGLSETLTISNFSAGRIDIKPVSGTTISTIDCMQIIENTAIISVNYLGTTGTSLSAFGWGILVRDSLYVEINNASIANATGSFGALSVGSGCHVSTQNISLSGCTTGVYSNYLSRVFSDNISGACSSYGLYATMSGEIIKRTGTTQPTGSIANEAYNNGGLIR